MLKQIFPVIGDEKNLPFYVVGLGVECWQFPVTRPNGHDYPQLFFTREGEGEITISGETIKLLPNTLFYIPPFCPHSYHATTDAWYIDWVSYSGDKAVELMEKWGLNKFAYFNGTDNERIHRIVNKMFYTLKSDKLYGNHYASAQLYDLLIEYRKIADNRVSSIYTSKSYALADVLQFIEENYSKHIRLVDLAKVAEVTEQHLCRLFKKNFQLRPMEYVAQVRVQHAKDLLVYTDKSIGEISDETGFQDSSYFSVVFKKYENVTPGEYRKSKT